VERRVTLDEELTPELATLLMNHSNMHFRQLQQKDPDRAGEMEPELQKMVTLLGSIVGEAQAMAQVQ